jgi:hypothetical protein
MNIYKISILLALIAAPYAHAEDKWSSKLPSDDKKALSALDDAVLNYAAKGKDNYTKAYKKMDDRVNAKYGAGAVFGGLDARSRLVMLKTGIGNIRKDAQKIATPADRDAITADLDVLSGKLNTKLKG